MKQNDGRRGAIRQKALKAVDLAKMEAHGKREDESGKRRQVREAEPLVVGGLDLREQRVDWMTDVKQQGNTAALHALVQYPVGLIDGTAKDQQERMLHHAVRFMNDFHGGDAVFAARVDRDEMGRHSVDVFMMPRHDFRYKDGRVVKRAAVSKHTKAEAQRRYGKQDRRSQGSALQDAWFEYMRDEMQLDVLPPKRKKATAKDRVEPEVYGIRKDREKIKEHAKKLLEADRAARQRNQMQADRLAIEKAEAASALEAARAISERRGDARGAKDMKSLQERLIRSKRRSPAAQVVQAGAKAARSSKKVSRDLSRAINTLTDEGR